MFVYYVNTFAVKKVWYIEEELCDFKIDAGLYSAKIHWIVCIQAANVLLKSHPISRPLRYLRNHPI